MANLLFEIGTEEIPARFMSKALADLKKNSEDILGKNRLSYKSVKTLGTDRRLAVIVTGLADKQPDLEQALKGPPKRIAVDDKGEFTQAAAGFAKKAGVEVKAIEFKKIGDEEYLYVHKKEKGQTPKDILPQLLTELVNSLHLPIAMRWGDLDFQFVRPIHWLVCLLGKNVLPVEIAGIKSGNMSQGHRFLTNKRVKISAPITYEKDLAKGHVIVDPEKRKELIRIGLEKISKAQKLDLVKSDDLLEEVTFLNELPSIVEAKIQEKYLSLPPEVLITSMKKNQKYFAFKDKSGKLSATFALVANGKTKQNEKNIISGNLKVLGARLEDAHFFYQEDVKIKLDDMVAGLKKVVYQEKIGTIYEKIERIVDISGWLSDKLNATVEEKEMAQRTAFVCKADLNSKMVYEFPELQGTMGAYYAAAQGENDIVAKAIDDHWKPRYAGDDVSAMSNVAAIVAIADKVDSIAGCYSADLKPTSSSDPYALRRAAQGIVTIMLDKGMELSLDELIEYALSKHNAPQLKGEIQKLFKGRLKFIMQDKQVKYDLIESVMGVPQEDVLTTVYLGMELQKIIAKKDYNKFVDTGVRVFRLSKEAKGTDVNEENFAEDIEKKVYDLVNSSEEKVTSALNNKNYSEAIDSLYQLADPVDEFFVKVLVMDEDMNKRNNRLAILKRLDKLFKKVGDFEKIVVEGAGK